MKARLAIVTGASRGIGAAIAAELMNGGWQVAGLDLSWTGIGTGMTAALDCDVTDFDAVQDAVSTIQDRCGPVTGLVNNAGITRDGLAHRMDPVSQWAPVIAVNLTGAFNMCRAVLPGMRSSGFGRVLGITSMNGLRGQFGQANYAAAKAGLIGLIKSVALENAGRDITANCIAPGFIDTDMARAMPEPVLASEIAKIPANRIGMVEDIARSASFLMSEAASFINGQTLSFNGGQLMP